MDEVTDRLARYRTKRDFVKTPEPAGEIAADRPELAFVIQKHAASRLHYDFRLELDGVMLSWAVPKGPSYDPKVKRMAVQVEDHPVSYNTFEGTIPPKQYGAGTVIIWDRGTWVPVGDPRAGLAAGKLLFTLHGQKMAGLWELVRIAKAGERQITWLLFKKHDAYERPQAEFDVVSAFPDSVVAKPIDPALRPAPAPTWATPATGVTSGVAAVVATPGPPATPHTRPIARRDGQVDPLDAPASTAALANAVESALPDKLAPQLATLSTGFPAQGEWTFELKFDGYRLMTRIERGVPRLITRGGHDWTSKMPGLAIELASLDLASAWLDGEIVVLGEDGTPSFNALQNALDRPQADHITYFLFDIPFFEGYDLRQVPLRARRARLETFLAQKQTRQLRFSAAFEGDPAILLQSARALKLEGLIAKRGDAPYVSRRTETWLKLKCRQQQSFVVGGYTDRSNDPDSKEIGSLLLGVHDDAHRLVSVGSVGTGWSSAMAAELKTRLVKLVVPTSPFAAGAGVTKGRWSKRVAGSERWVAPRLTVDVGFAEWTPEGQIRHATFEGLSVKRSAKKTTRAAAAAPGAVAPGATRLSTKVSNPQRVIDASTGLTKLDLIRYYESVAEWMLPHLVGRPCSLVRGPTGIGGELFFQKHAGKLRIDEVKDLDPALWPDHEALLEIPTPRALAGAAQMNVIEFHTWNALARNIDKPDRMVFDLDPGDGVSWKHMVEATALTRAFLQELGLEAWLKTSGGKGLHVIVPLQPRYDWATVKGFSQAVVQHLARVLPDRFVAKSGPTNRVGKIFVDYLRNSHGATTVAAFSARARPGLGVSMPVEWDGLEFLKSGSQWTIATAREHLSFQTSDPWAQYWKAKQPLAAAMKRLGFKPSS
ncbi:MAG: DNA ligase D [Proteobacteria bacterium]|nr:DNA ligase D [Burkholderiales bacterium]